MKTVYSDDHRHQDGKAELIDGKLLPCFEMPRRADMILARVKETKLGEVLAPARFRRRSGEARAQAELSSNSCAAPGTCGSSSMAPMTRCR